MQENNYYKVQGYAKEARSNAYDQTPEQYLISKIKDTEAEIERLKDEQERETARLKKIDREDYEEQIRKGAESPKGAMNYFDYFKKKGREILSINTERKAMIEALDLIDYENGISKIQHFLSLIDYQREYNAIKATSTPNEVVSKLMEDKSKYRKMWYYYVGADNRLPEMGTAKFALIDEILKFIDTELDAIAQTSTDKREKPKAIRKRQTKPKTISQKTESVNNVELQNNVFNFDLEREQLGQTSTGTAKDQSSIAPETSTEKANLFDYEREIAGLKDREWKGIQLSFIIHHFEVFVTQKSKNKKEYLSKQAFISFLKRGFLNDETQPKQTLNLSGGENGFLILRFYEFYTIANTRFGFPNPKDPFKKIVFDCFNNWNKKTIDNYFKPGKTKRKW